MNRPSQSASAPEDLSPRKAAQRRALLDGASEILMQDGPAGLSLRKLAARVGVSTMAVYTAFGGKEGLMRALFEEAFERLAEAQARAPASRDPLISLANSAAAYRRFALANPAYYALMISITMPLDSQERHAKDDVPAARSIAGQRAFSFLLDGIERAQKGGLLRTDVPTRQIADSFWAMVHGLCSLELAGYDASKAAADRRFAIATEAIMRGFLQPQAANSSIRKPERAG